MDLLFVLIFVSIAFFGTGFASGILYRITKEKDKLMKDSLDMRNFRQLPKSAKRKEFTAGIDRRELERRLNKK